MLGLNKITNFFGKILIPWIAAKFMHSIWLEIA